MCSSSSPQWSHHGELWTRTLSVPDKQIEPASAFIFILKLAPFLISGRCQPHHMNTGSFLSGPYLYKCPIYLQVRRTPCSFWGRSVLCFCQITFHHEASCVTTGRCLPFLMKLLTHAYIYSWYFGYSWPAELHWPVSLRSSGGHGFSDEDRVLWEPQRVTKEEGCYQG